MDIMYPDGIYIPVPEKGNQARLRSLIALGPAVVDVVVLDVLEAGEHAASLGGGLRCSLLAYAKKKRKRKEKKTYAMRLGILDP